MSGARWYLAAPLPLDLAAELLREESRPTGPDTGIRASRIDPLPSLETLRLASAGTKEPEAAARHERDVQGRPPCKPVRIRSDESLLT